MTLLRLLLGGAALLLGSVEVGGSLLYGVGDLEIKLEGCHHPEVLVGVAVVFNDWQEGVVGGQIKLLFDFSVGDAKHDVFLDVDKDLHLSERVLLDADLAPHDDPFFLLR